MATKRPNLAKVRRQAHGGSPRAQRLLGKRYLTGKGVPRDARKAVKLLSSAAKRGDRGAKEVLRKKLRSADRHESPANLKFIRIAAEEGVRQAQRLLGEKHLSGRGLPRDARRAAEWLRSAAKLGDRAAKEIIRKNLQGIARHDGSGDLEFVRVLAETGIAQAQYALGMSYLVGGDDWAAEEWFHRAADQGCADALYRLGTMSLDCQDRQPAIERITIAAKRGSVKAQRHLVRMHFVDGDPLCARTLALECLELALVRGANYHDTNSRKLLEESAKWLLRAANNHDARAQCIVGRMRLLGIGLRRNMSIALNWLRRAAEQGHAEAARLLALNAVGGSTSSNSPGSTGTAHT